MYSRRIYRSVNMSYRAYVLKNRNFHFEGDKAYTEDCGVIIYNVFVHKIPKKTTEEELLKLFEKFGEVEKVHWVGNKTSSKSGAPKNAFIYFKDAFSAAKVLKNPSYNLQMGKIFVKACDSWHQPQNQTPCPRQWGLLPGIVQPMSKNQLKVLEALQPLQQQQQMKVESYTTSQLNILQLNDDCLGIICQKLDQMRNQICFARVCKRFRNIFRMVSKSKYKVFEVEDSLNLTLWEYRDFFKIAGQYIKKLTLTGLLGLLDDYWKRIIEFAGNFCTNVESLKLSQIHIRSSTLHFLLIRMKNITELELNHCKLKDSATMAIKKSTKLEVLSLCNLDSITGKHLKGLKNIRELIIDNCRNLMSRDIDEILKYCMNLETFKTDIWNKKSLAFLPKLKKLELQTHKNCHELLIKLAEHKAEQMEYLQIRNLTYENAKVVASLKQLKHLICMSNYELNDNYLYAFAELGELEDIDISESQEISDAGLLQLLRKCSKLKSINIEGCSTITAKFVYEAIKLLEKNSKQRNTTEPLLCYAFDTKIERCILKDHLYIAGQSHMKIIFRDKLL